LLSGRGNTRAYGAASSDPVRLVAQIAAALSIGAGVIHVSAAGDHTELPVLFAGFMLVAILQIALGGLLLRRPLSRLLIAGAVAMMLSSIGLWVLSRTAGLPFIEGGHLEPIGFKDGVAKLFETASIPALLLLLSPELARVSTPPRLGGQVLALMGAGCFALMTPAMLLGGGEHHSHAEAVALGIHDAHEDGAGLADATPHEAHARSSGATTHDTKNHTTPGHEHSDVQLAHAPRTTSHDHGADGDPQDSHTRHTGEKKVEHHRGKHDDRPHDKRHGDDHGGGHGGGSHGEEPGGQDAISVTYEPEPRVCIGDFCLP
jgi:hypothetical protein